MAQIKISEIDSTILSNAVAYENCVYVPGFVSPYSVGDDILDQYEKKQCNTLTEFETYFGTATPYFLAEQKYPNNTSEIYFNDNAISGLGTNPTMFAAGSYDPGYIIAKALLFRGIKVIYERVNGTVGDITISAYNSSSAYNLGDYCYHADDGENQCYICTSNITSEEAKVGHDWDASEWTKIYFSVTDRHKAIQDASPYSTSKSGGYTVGDYCTHKKDSVSCLYYCQATVSEGAEWNESNWLLITESENGDKYLVPNLPTTTTDAVRCVYKVSDTNGDTIYYRLNDLTNKAIVEAKAPASMPNVGDMYKAFVGETTSGGHASIFKELSDKDTFEIQYITSGGYPTFECYSAVTGEAATHVAQILTSVAELRGDAVALIDHTDNPKRSLDPSNTTSVYGALNNGMGFGCANAAMFTPWATYDIAVDSANGVSMLFPASVGYLLAVANAYKTSDAYVSVAGVTRGQIPGFGAAHTNKTLSNAYALAYQNCDAQNRAINAITYIKNYGDVIYGNKTLYSSTGLKASHYLNIRLMVADIKKLVLMAAKTLMFEQNNDILWINFQAKVKPTLEQMKTSYGISNYKLVKLTSDTANQLKCKILIYPAYPVDDFDITIELSNEDVTVSTTTE